MSREMGFDYMGMSYQGAEGTARGPGLGDFWVCRCCSCFLILAAVVRKVGRCRFSVLLSTPGPRYSAQFAVLWLRRARASVLFYPAYMVQIENDVYSQIGLVMLIGLAAKERDSYR